MKLTKEIREFFWPLLAPLKKKNFVPFKVEDLTANKNYLNTCYDLTLRYYNSENERKNTIESKSTIFIGSIGFVIAILLSMATGLLLNPKIQVSFLTSFSVIMWIVIVIYFCRAVWFSIKALERQKYHTIGYKDYTKKKINYMKELITDIINTTRKNSTTINLKVDNMVMAQEYFKRGIIAIILYTLVAGMYGLIFTGFGRNDKKKSFDKSIFGDTMVEMTWEEIKKEADNGAIVLFPIAVVEEHGPHMNLSPDIYLTCLDCRLLKKRLEKKGIRALIAPVYYWGINSDKNLRKFPGTFSVKPETFKAILKDNMECLKLWGFKEIFCVNLHGDPRHRSVLDSSIDEIRKTSGIDVYDVGVWIIK